MMFPGIALKPERQRGKIGNARTTVGLVGNVFGQAGREVASTYINSSSSSMLANGSGWGGLTGAESA